MNKGKETCLKKYWHKAAMAVMALAMVVFMVPMTASAGEVMSGTLKENGGISWEYDAETKTLTLTGESSSTGNWLWLKNTVQGEFRHIIFENCKINGSTQSMFANMPKVESIVFKNVDTSNVTSMANMFEGCSSLKVLDLGDFNTANVTSMNGMFSGCSALEELNVSSFDTSKVEVMATMFADCTNLKNVDLSSFNTSKVYAMGGMFDDCKSLVVLDLSNLNTSKAMLMWGMFKGCNNLEELDISNFDMSVADYVQDMFTDCNKLKKIVTPTKIKANLNIALPHEFVTTDERRTTQLTENFTKTILIADIQINPFADVKETSWQYKATKYVYDNGLMTGKGTDANGNIIFDPNKPIPREEFVQVLYNASGKPAVNAENIFPDVKNTWYKNAVLWAYENNIAKGKGNGDFGVTESISRQDLALMLYKYASLKGYDLSANAGEINKYADGNKVSSYAKTAMDWAVSKGIMSGKGTKGEPISTFKLDPTGTATRAECAAMLMNFMEAY